MPGLTLVGVLALWLAVAVPATGTVSAQAMDDATLSSLTLSVGELDPAFDSATIMYTATVANTVTETTVAATPTNSSAAVAFTYQDGMTFPVAVGGTVPLSIGRNNVFVVVTAEDGTTTKLYSITVTRPLPLVVRSISPSTVAPGGTFEVTLDFDPARTGLTAVDEFLPDGFSWVDADYGRLIYSGLDPTDSQTLFFTLFGMVSTVTYQVTASDMPGVYEITGTMLTGVMITEPVLGDTQITVALLPEVTVPLWDLTFDEGSSGTYAVRLGQQPTADVTVAITSNNTDVTVSPASLTFTPDNWNSRQTVTMNAAEDTDHNYDTAILTHTATSTAPAYIGISVDSVDVIVIDNDVTVMFGAAAYEVREGEEVIVTLTLSAALSPALLDEYRIFATANLQGGANNIDFVMNRGFLFPTGTTSVEKTFEAKEDDNDDDNESVLYTLPTESEFLPHGVSVGTPATTTVSIIDDDDPQVFVAFMERSYRVAEGDDVTVTVFLNVDPERTVVIPLVATNQGGATSADYSALPPDVTFNSGNTEQTFTFTAEQDDDDDANESVLLAFGTLPDGVMPASISTTTVGITNVPPVTVSFGRAAYTVTEGRMQMVTVTLSEAVGSEVVIPLTHMPQTGATSADYAGVPMNVTFDTRDTEQTFTFDATDDAIDDDGERVLLAFGTLPSGVIAGTPDEVTFSITDNDTRGITFTPTSLPVDEGGMSTYTVVLDTEPTETVTVTIVNPTDNTDVTANPASLTFTTTTWNTAQTVTVSAAEDDDSTRDTATVTHTVAGGDYELFAAPSVSVTVTDNDTPGVTVTPPSLTVGEGSTDTYTVKLNTQPTGDVTVAISSNNSDVSASPSPLTFTTTTWSAEQTVTVTAGQDADAANDTAALTHNPGGGGYNSVSNASLTVTVTDDDTRGVTVTPTSLPVDEGGTGTYTVKLDTEPSDAVTVTINDPTDNTDVSANPASLTFSTSNWATAQTVTVSAAEDDDAANDTATVTHSVSGGDYGSVTAADVGVTVTDNDTPGVTASPTSLTIGEGTAFNTYTVVLNTQPSGQVTVAISSDNTDVTSSPSSLTFTTSNWNSAQTVTITVGTDLDGANETAELTLDPSGADYGSVSNASVDVTVNDNDTRGVTVTPTSLPVDEGGTNTYTVVLDTEPSDAVTVTINDPTDNTDVSANPASLTFSTSDWATAQTVTVSAVEDDDSARDTATVTHTVAGGDYASFAASSVAVTVTDNDTPGVTVTPLSLTIGEGGTGTYTVVLNTQPSGDVTVAISSNNSDVTASPSPLTFTTTTWSAEQTVTVTAGQDADAADDTANLTHNPSGANYGSVSNAILTVTVTDNETRGVTVTPTSLSVDEGGTNTYTVVLDTRPTAAVTVTINDPTDNTDVTANPASLTFFTSDWATAQTVTVSAAEDDDPLEDTATVTHTVAGGDYASFAASSVAVTVTDNDTPGVTVTPMSLTITEGGNSTYTVELNTQPTAQVTVAISSNNTDVTVPSSTLTFTTTNWNSAQTVTVSAGQDDDAANDTATLTHDPSGADYDFVSNADLTVTVTDNDTRGVTVTPTSLSVNEGGTNTYTVKLDTEPSDAVTVTINDPTDNTDVTANPASLTFSTSNWATAQTVTVSAAEDDDSTRDTATVTHTVAGGDYDSFAASSVAVTVTDNDTPGVTVTPLSLTIGEGGTDTYTVVLNTQPSGDVTVAISSNNTDVTASPSPLTFTTTTWSTEQTVTVTAGQDADAADDTANLTHNPSGANYGSVSNAILTVTVTDNETRGVTVTPTSLSVDEGGTNTYTVVLDTRPTAAVTVTIVDPTDNADVTANPASLTFFTSDWATAQTVTVSAAEDDDPLEDTATVTHTVAGGDYASFAASSVAVTVTDNDTPGVTVTPMSLTITEGGNSTYTVELNTQPTAQVTVAISSNNTDVTVPSSTLTFTTTNWNSAQTVTVSAGQDDDAANDTATLTHDPSGADYDSVSDAILSVTVTDNDTRGVTVTPTSLTVNEGGTNTYTVKLDTEPSDAVTVTINDPTDNADVTANPASLTFSTSNWATAQTVTVSAAEDDDSTRDTATVTHTVAGGDYASFAASSVAVTVTDNDTPGVTVTPLSLTVGEGGTGTYTVVLNTQPSGDVTVAISSNNTDVTASSSPLTFTTTTWSTEQTVTVSAGQDADAANDMATLTHNPSGGGYNSVSNAILTVTVTDDDTRGVTVTPTSLTVDEGGTNTYTVVLDTQPTATVTVTIVDPTDNADVTANPANLRFSTSNWATAQTVTVSAAEDGDALEDTAAVTHTVAGGDYDSFAASSVAVTVTDDDTPGVTVSPASLTVGEGGTGRYTVKLNTQPSGDVTVGIVSNNTDVTVPPSSLTFTTTNWNSAQTVTVSAGQDADAANDTATLTHDPSGADYDSVSNAILSVTVTDNDTRGVTVTPTSLTVNEGGTNTYTVVLDTEPSDAVTVTINDPTDNTDVSANPASLTFSTSNWATAQTVTVSAAEDDDSTRDTATVTHTVAGGDYAAITASSVAVTVADNDVPGVTVTPLSLMVGEGGSGTYTVVLNTQPSGDVTVAISSNNSDVSASPSPLTFTTTTWSAEQTVTVTAGQDDDAANDTAALTHNPGGGGYNSVSNASLTVTVTDDETAGVTVTPTSLTVDEGGTNTYTVVLDTRPTAAVTVTIVDPTDNADVSANPANLRFSTSNWATAQTVTVSAAEDADASQDTATVTHTVAGGDYGSVTADDVAVTVTDNDTPGVTVTPTSLTVGEGGTGRYTVVLDTEPTDTVTVTIVDPTNTDVTASPASLTFTASDWATAQTVTVSAAEDIDLLQDTATVTHTVAGGDYASFAASSVVVTVTDNDAPGVMVSPTSLTITEGGNSTYTVELNTQPSGEVTVAISSNNTDVTASPSPLTFTTTTWSAEQTVTVTAGQDDDAANDTAALTHDPSGADYDFVSNADLAVTVTDDDTRGVTFTPPSLTVDEGGTNTYTVVLDTEPTAAVTVTVNDPTDNADVTAGPASLTFSTSNWDTAQTVTVSAAEDDDALHDTATVTHTLAGGDYDSFAAPSVAVTVADNEAPGVAVSFGAATYTAAEGSGVTVTVQLSADPGRRVTIPITAANHGGASNGDYSGVPANVTFGATERRKTFTFTATQDTVDDDGESVQLGFGTLPTDVSAGRPSTSTVSITDNDTRGVTVNKLEPYVKEVSLRGGDSVRLSIIPYGRQNIVDDALIDGKVGVTWSLEGGTGDFSESDPGLDADNEANDREIMFTAPTSPGTYVVHATLKTCGLNVSVDCRASFTVHVLRRASRPIETKPVPVNPAGSIPSILVDSEGNQYEVFTPEGGGTFAGDTSSLKAGPGAVPNGEIVGLRISEGGSASNEGKTYQRYRLGGNWYEISAVDASRNNVSSYGLNDALDFCIPLPDALRSNISDLAIVAINSDDSLTILSSIVRISPSGTKVCGSLSSVPAKVTVGTAGSPAPLPTEVPDAGDASDLPETGGAAPSNDGMLWAMIVGLAIMVSGYAVLRTARRTEPIRSVKRPRG